MLNRREAIKLVAGVAVSLIVPVVTVVTTSVVAGIEHLRITTTGNVGIGITPTAVLHIRGIDG